MRWPLLATARPLVESRAYAAPLPFGTLVTRSQLRAFGGVTSVTCRWGVCWGLGAPTGVEYPLRSTDGGKSWAIGGPFFAVPAADAAAFASEIRQLGPSLVVANLRGGQFLYFTGDGGRSWNVAGFGCNIVRPFAVAPDLRLVCQSYFSPQKRTYVSTDGGYRWRLQPGP